MSKIKFEAAKQHIKRGEYTAARRILATMDGEKAREWEHQLDKLAPVKRQSNTLRYILVIAVVVIGIAAAVLWAQNGGIYSTDNALYGISGP